MRLGKLQALLAFPEAFTTFAETLKLNYMKNLISLAAVVAMAAAMVSCGDKDGGGTEQSGVFGTLTWKLTEKGTLTISGTGEMPDFDPDDVGTAPGGSHYINTSPWISHKDDITAVIIADGVTNIGELVFFQCNALTSVTIGAGVTSIENTAFAYCTALASIDIPDNVTTIGKAAFAGCTALKSVAIGDGVESIEQGAFAGCTALASVTIGDGVEIIGKNAFDSCSALTSIIIGAGVKSVGNEAFHCMKLASVTCRATTPPSLGPGNFYASGDVLHVPAGSVDAYKADSLPGGYGNPWTTAFAADNIVGDL